MAITEDLERNFGIAVTVTNGFTEVELAGELDLSTAPQLRECLAQSAVSGSPTFRVDLTRVTFLDSTSIGLLVGTCKRVRTSGGAFFVVCDPRTSVQRLFEVSGLVEFLQVRRPVAATPPE
jgi:anti-sigma B factor antagonist